MSYKSIIIFIFIFLTTTAIASEHREYPQFLTEDIETLRQESNIIKNKNAGETIPRWIALYEKGNLWEKQIALDSLRFLAFDEYRKDKSVFEPILKGLKDKDPSVRAATANYFKYIGELSTGCCKDMNIVPSLIDSLKDKSLDVRRETAKALAYFKDKRSVDPLIKILQDNDPWVRLEAIFALGEIKERKAILPLLNLISDDSDFRYKFIQQECLIAIGKIASPTIRRLPGDSYNRETIDNLKSQITSVLINKFNDPYLKPEIIKSFAKLEIKEAEGMLQEEASKDQNLQTSVLAIKALNKLSLPMPQMKKLDDSSITLLIRSLKDPSPEVRESSIIKLGYSKDERVIDPLIEMLDDKDRYIVNIAISSLGNFKEERILDILVPFLDSDIFGVVARSSFLSVSYNTAQGELYYYLKDGELSIVQRRNPSRGTNCSTHIHHPHAADLLVHALEKVNEKAKTELLDLLWHFHSENFTPPLIKFLSDHSPTVRKLAITRLVGFEGRNALPYIMNALDDKDPEIRELTVKILGDFKADQATKQLFKKLKDPKPKVRMAAARTLGEIKDIKAIDPLIEALSDENDDVVRLALQSLGEFNDPRILDINIMMFEHKFPYVRTAAVRNIIKNPDKRAVDALIPLLNDNDRNVRFLSAEALGKIGDKKAVEPLIRAFNGETGPENGRDNNLRIKAAQALAKIGDRSAVPHLTKALGDQSLGSTAEWALESFGIQSKEKEIQTVPQITAPLKPSTTTELIVLKIPKEAMDREPLYRRFREPRRPVRSEEDRTGNNEAPSSMKQDGNSGENPEKKTVTKETINQTARGVVVSEQTTGRGQTPLLNKQSIKPEQINGPEEIKSVRDLITSLKDNDRSIRLEAARELGKRKVKDATTAIIDCLDETDINIRVALIQALGEINDPRAVKPLSNLINENNRKIRTISFVSLGMIHGSDAREVLINALASKNDYRVRIEAADTLGKTGMHDAVPNLISLLADNNEYVRQAAVRSLGLIKEKEAVEPLIRMLDDHDFYVRLWTIKSLIKINDSKAIPPLLDLALSEKEDKTGSLSFDGLKQFKDYEAIGIMRKIFFDSLASNSYRDRKRSEMIFSILGEKSILRSLQDPGENDQKTVQNYIRLLMIPPSSPLIRLGEKALRDFNNRGLVIKEISGLIKTDKMDTNIINIQAVNKSGTAISFLRSLNDPSCIPVFIYVLKNRKDYQTSTARSACIALGDLSYSDAAPLLLQIVVDPVERSHLRMDASTALGKIGAKDAVLPLIDIIINRSEEKTLRMESIKALGDIRDNLAVEPLINILKDADEDRWIRVASASALGNIGDQRAVVPLKETIKDSNLKQVSQSALNKLQLRDESRRFF